MSYIKFMFNHKLCFMINKFKKCSSQIFDRNLDADIIWWKEESNKNKMTSLLVH